MFTAGYNAAGYLPEADTHETDDAHEAMTYVCETATENGDLDLHMVEPMVQEGVIRLVRGERAAFTLNGNEYWVAPA